MVHMELLLMLAHVQKLPLLPYVKSTSYILKKFSGNPPSLIIHLHQLNFRFEGQDGSFGYGSPMRVCLQLFCASKLCASEPRLIYGTR